VSIGDRSAASRRSDTLGRMSATQPICELPLAVRRGVVLVALLLGGCPRPGEGCKADAGYRRAAPVIAALARYHQARGSYPATLHELTPDWLAAPPQSLQYVRREDRYQLTFSYTGPGVNHCTYDPGTTAPKPWQCRGYY